MSEIILNEREWVENALDRRELGKKPGETIGRLARYLYFEGYRKDEIGSRIEDFLIKCDPTINVIKWQGIIDSVAKNAGKYKLIDVEGVLVTHSEMERIGRLKGKMLQKLMFTILCIAKYRNAVSKTNNSWVNYDAKDIFALANITVASKRKSLMINDLWREGYIGYSRVVDNVNINVKIIDEDSEQLVFINDFRNLGNQYMSLVGNGYVKCAECGIVIKRTSPSKKYCKACADRIHLRQSLDSYYKSVS